MMKVSVIVPVYNVARYLPQCLNSLCAQSESEWEAILVDDGSTDDSGTICDEYARRDSRFRVIHQKNAGAANAKNVGLAQAQGEYIAFLDSDDYVESVWMERMLDTAEEHHADIVECDFDRVYRGYGEPGNGFQEPTIVFSTQEYLAQYLSIWSCSIFWNKIYKKEVMEGICFGKERRCIDDEFFTYKVISSAEKIVRIRDVLYHYRQRGSSAVYKEENQLQITEDALEVLIERYEWIVQRFPALRRIYLRHDVDILFYFAGFTHNMKTVDMFRKISRYYMKQVVFHGADRITVLNALRLLGISDKRLLERKNDEANQKDVSQYFE